MRAEIISIGDELTSGQRLDTNSQWLSQRLGELGIPVVAHVTVADDKAMNVEVFRHATARADIVISTGGLGPTADDLTREVLAEAIGRPLRLDQPSLDHIRAMFTRRKREMPERNVVQAMFPEGSRIIANPEGTAPGIDIDVPRGEGRKSRVFALPGVPAEMKQMWHETVAPIIAGMSGAPRVIRHKRVKCFGVGESALEQMLPDLIRRGRDPSVGITVHEGTITLRITASAPTGPECYEQMEPTLATIHECLGGLVFGYEDDEIEHAVVRQLTSTGQTLAVCEWGTAGLVTRWLGDANGRSGAFLGGATIVSPVVASSVWGVASDLMTQHGTHSGPVAQALAEAVRRHYGADYGLAVSDLPPAIDSGKLTEEWSFALAGPMITTVKSAPSAAHSAIVKPLAAKTALNLVRLALMNKS
ncbi:MAG: CinA family nicotinamide mononucleotide deamidase-related protein [Planctomycetaceae bacterium]|nr:CinA family nicotinamide mononucleotide deamidase-related protein [Planctomycetaceae bacterium]